MASSISNWLFGSSTNPKADSTSVVTQGQPEWWLENVKNLISKSSAIAAEPYRAYTGQQIAGPSADTTRAYDLTRAGIGNWQPAFNTATNTLSNISTGNANSVMDMIARRGQQNFAENILPELDKTFIGAGQFGSGRNQEFMARAARDVNQNILDAQAGAFLQNQGQQAAAAQGLGALSQQGQQAGLRDAAALQGIGAEQQALQQRSLDLAKQQFEDEKNYPRETAQFMSQIIRGYNPPTSTTRTDSSPATNAQMGASPLAQLAGAGAAAYGAGRAFGVFAKGGAVKGYASGGSVSSRARRSENARITREWIDPPPVPKAAGGAVKGIGRYARGGQVTRAPKPVSASKSRLSLPRPTAGIGEM